MLSARGQVSRVFAANGIAAVVKVVVMLVVRESYSLTAISLAGVVVVALESLLFILQLRVPGEHEGRQVAMALMRAILAATCTSAVLYALPGTWEPVTADRLAALITGALIGSVAFAVFAVCQALLWIGAGHPAGPEELLNAMIRDLVRRSA